MADNIEYKDGYSIKRYPPEALDGALSRIKASNGVLVKLEDASGEGTSQHFKKYVLSNKKREKIIIQYAVKSKVVQLQGKRSQLFDLAQNIIASQVDFKDVLQSRIEYNQSSNEPEQEAVKPDIKPQAAKQPKQEKKPAPANPTKPNGAAKPPIDTKKPEPKKTQDKLKAKPSAPAAKIPSAADFIKRLERAIPHAANYLPEQSKQYLLYTYADLETNNMFNYAGILGDAYRALEHLISHLQKTEKIEVKLIGQGYDKDGEGNYILKPAYAKRIGSVVYAEVMRDLYTEYYKKRHYFSHSDNEGGEVRIISDKNEARAQFCSLLELLDYNCKKLSELANSAKYSAKTPKQPKLL